MPIAHFVRQAGLRPEETQILTEAFDTAWERFKASGSPLAQDACAPSTRALLAKRIIETAQTGERRGDRLIADALDYLAGVK
jgi:hypothetical protein